MRGAMDPRVILVSSIPPVLSVASVLSAYGMAAGPQLPSAPRTVGYAMPSCSK